MLNSVAESRAIPNKLEADIERLNAFAESHRAEYAQAGPFPHTMIEDFLDPELLRRVSQEFPEPNAVDWGAMVDKDQKKYAANRTEQLGPATRQVLHFLNGREIINFLEKLTGITGLVPDPHLAGGGLHELRAGRLLEGSRRFQLAPPSAARPSHQPAHLLE